MEAAQLSETEMLAEHLLSVKYDPYQHALTAYPWGQKGTVLESDLGPRKWQAEELIAIGEHLQNPETRHQPYRSAIASGHGVGKGHKLNHKHVKLIKRNKDSFDVEDVMWGDLKVGDYVFGSDGRPVKITATSHYRRQHYRITFDDGSSTEVSGEHEWAVRGRKERRNKIDGWRILETQEILSLGVLRKNGKSMAKQWEIPIQGVAQYKERTVYAPYTVGVWLGDGTSSSGQICSSRGEIWARIGISPSKKTKTFERSGVMEARPAGLNQWLIECGARPTKCDTKHVPDCYKHNSEQVRRDILSGLLDSDGETNKSNSIGFSSTSKQLVLDVIWLVRSLGGKAQLQKAVKETFYVLDGVKSDPCKPCYRCTINFGGLWNPFTHTDKKALLADKVEHRYLCRWISEIEPLNVTDGMCITVDAEDHLYLANDFIVTHNSSLVSMVVNWAMDTAEDTKIIITANTEGQLKTKTSPEVGKWCKLNISHVLKLFKTNVLSIHSTIPEHEKHWRADFIAWSEHNPDAFQGAHNKGKRLVIIFDEASGIPDIIWEVMEGAESDADTEIIWLAFGNPIHAKGRFRECWRKFKSRWRTRNIDSRDVEGTNKQELSKKVDLYGEDSDYIKTRVRGLFPSASSSQFFPTGLLDESKKRHLRHDQYDFAPLILTCDPAWWGDDWIVIGYRQGLYHKILEKFPKNDNDVMVANKLMRYEDDLKADAVFIDQGYGQGIYSVGTTVGRSWTLIAFGSRAGRADCKNKRAEMIVLTKEWLKEGGVIDPDPELYDEMEALEALPMMDGQYHFPTKDVIKKELGRSPNCLDQLGLTFALPVFKKDANINSSSKRTKSDYNPIRNRLSKR